jgi:GAF domain-containing protein
MILPTRPKFDFSPGRWFDPAVTEPRLDDLVGSTLQGIVDWLLEAFGVDRVTLRRAVPDDFYPVVFEARTERARTLIGDTEIDLRGQPVVRVLSEDRAQVVQHDARTAFDDQAFQRMLASYGGLGAQIVTPVHVQDALVAIISLHQLGGPRRWSPGEVALARDAAAVVAGILAAEGSATLAAGEG